MENERGLFVPIFPRIATGMTRNKMGTPATMKSSTNSVTADAIAVQIEPQEAIPYGTQFLEVELPGGKTGKIDRAFLSGKSTLKLRHIDACLKAAGLRVDTKKSGQTKEGREARKWFNKNVRDVYHAALRHLNKQFLTNGTPVSVGITDRKARKTGQITRTAKFGYEVVMKRGEPEAAKQIANGEAKKTEQGKSRAKRQPKSIGTVGQIATLKETGKSVKPEEPETIPAQRDTVPAVETVATA